jgi:hypothetical protein
MEIESGDIITIAGKGRFQIVMIRADGFDALDLDHKNANGSAPRVFIAFAQEPE